MRSRHAEAWPSRRAARQGRLAEAIALRRAVNSDGARVRYVVTLITVLVFDYFFGVTVDDGPARGLVPSPLPLLPADRMLCSERQEGLVFTLSEQAT